MAERETGEMREEFQKSLKGDCTSLSCLDYDKVQQILWERLGNIFEQSFEVHKNSELTC